MIQLLPGCVQSGVGVEEPSDPQPFLLLWLQGQILWRPLVQEPNIKHLLISGILGYLAQLSCVVLRNQGTLFGVTLPSAQSSSTWDLGENRKFHSHNTPPVIFCLYPGVLSILCFGFQMPLPNISELRCRSETNPNFDTKCDIYWTADWGETHPTHTPCTESKLLIYMPNS